MANTKDKIKNNVHSDHRKRMRDKFIENGIAVFADHEIIEFLLFYAIPRKDVNALAHQLLSHFGSISAVLEASIESLMQIEGIGENTATYIHFLFELFNRYNKDTHMRTKLSSSAVTKAYCKRLYTEPNVEQFYVICVGPSNKIINQRLINSGTMTKVNVNIRQITDFALKNKCERIIITHNHTSEKCMPSDEDISFTRSIICSCMLNDIDVLNHIVVSRTDSASFAELGILNSIKQSAFNTMPLPAKAKKSAIFDSTGYIVSN